MTYTVAIQADSFETLNFTTDTSLMLAHVAFNRGHRIFFYMPQDMSLRIDSEFKDPSLFVQGRWVKFLGSIHEQNYTISQEESLNLASADIVLVRQDPPFDLAYITSTYLLEHLPATILIVNNPTEIRNCPEKLFVTHFPNLFPPTLVSRNFQEIKDFKSHHKKIIIKPLYKHGGRDVFVSDAHDPNFKSLLDLLFSQGKEPFIFQKYLPEIKEGDKRLFLLDGELLALYLRVPVGESILANTVAGGVAQKTPVTAREEEIIQTLGPLLKRKGLLLAGLDIIGGYVTEINVTSPTGLAHYNRLEYTAVEGVVWDKIEEKFLEIRSLLKG